MPSTIVIAGTHSGAGKTTITTGILRALYNRNLIVQPFKSGPDYIDPAFHSFVSKNTCRNLDLFMLGEDELKKIFYKHSSRADISVVEGVMGLYDGLGTKRDNGSTAHISKIISAPVILVIDGKGMSSSAAALVMGYQNYDEKVNIAGVIVNNMHGQKHYDLLKESIERDTGIKCVGYLNKKSSISLESRHLGLIPAVEVDELDVKVDELAQMVEETIDIDAILEIAKQGSKFEHINSEFVKNYKLEIEKKREVEKCTDEIKQSFIADKGQKTDKFQNKASDKSVNSEDYINTNKIKIAIAKDKAFNFYYDDGLDTLVELGAELVYFSPIYDSELPEAISGLYIGGGFPEVFAEDIEKNVSMRKSIKSAIEKGLPTYAECGGLMYLSKSIETLDEKNYEMCGVFDFDTHMTKRLQRFGYVNVDVNEGAFVDKNKRIKAHEFHRSKVTGDEDAQCSYDVYRARAGAEHMHWDCGYRYKNCLAGYAHVHFSGSIDFAKDFVRACVEYELGR